MPPKPPAPPPQPARRQPTALNSSRGNSGSLQKRGTSGSSTGINKRKPTTVVSGTRGGRTSSVDGQRSLRRRNEIVNNETAKRNEFALTYEQDLSKMYEDMIEGMKAVKDATIQRLERTVVTMRMASDRVLQETKQQLLDEAQCLGAMYLNCIDKGCRDVGVKGIPFAKAAVDVASQYDSPQRSPRSNKRSAQYSHYETNAAIHKAEKWRERVMRMEAAAITSAASSTGGKQSLDVKRSYTPQQQQAHAFTDISLSSSDFTFPEVIEMTKELSTALENVIHAAASKLRYTDMRLHFMEAVLQERDEQLVATDRILNNYLIRAPSDIDRSIDMVRALGEEVQLRLTNAEGAVLQLMDDFLHETAVIRMEGDVASGAAHENYRRAQERETVVSNFRCKVNQIKIQQGDLMQLIREEIIGLTKSRLIANVDRGVPTIPHGLGDEYAVITNAATQANTHRKDNAKETQQKFDQGYVQELSDDQFNAATLAGRIGGTHGGTSHYFLRSNIPKHFRTRLENDTRLYDRKELLRMLDIVSHEPRVTEVIISIMREYEVWEEKQRATDDLEKAREDIAAKISATKRLLKEEIEDGSRNVSRLVTLEKEKEYDGIIICESVSRTKRNKKPPLRPPTPLLECILRGDKDIPDYDKKPSEMKVDGISNEISIAEMVQQSQGKLIAAHNKLLQLTDPLSDQYPRRRGSYDKHTLPNTYTQHFQEGARAQELLAKRVNIIAQRSKTEADILTLAVEANRILDPGTKDDLERLPLLLASPAGRLWYDSNNQHQERIAVLRNIANSIGGQKTNKVDIDDDLPDLPPLVARDFKESDATTMSKLMAEFASAEWANGVSATSTLYSGHRRLVK